MKNYYIKNLILILLIRIKHLMIPLIQNQLNHIQIKMEINKLKIIESYNLKNW